MMMFDPALRLIMIGALAGAVVGCAQISGNAATTEKVQLQAHFDCQFEQGVDVPEAIQAAPTSTGGVSVSTVSGSGLSAAQAKAINQCASAKLRNPATVYRTEVQLVTAQGTEPVAERAVAPVAKSAKPLEPYSSCQKGYGPMQGAVRICPGY